MDSNIPLPSLQKPQKHEFLKPVSVWLFVAISCGLSLSLFGSTIMSFASFVPASFVSFGIGFATFILASIWIALGTGPYWKRLLGSFSCATIVSLGLALAVFFVAMTENGKGMHPGDIFYFLSGGPMLWLIIQIPFWVARVGRGWRVGLEQSVDTNFKIVDIMAFTLLVAISVAALNIQDSRLFVGNSPGQLIGMVGIPYLVMVICGAAIGLPAVCFLLKQPKRIRTGQKLDQYEDSVGKGCGRFFIATLLVNIALGVFISIISTGLFSRMPNSSTLPILLLVTFSLLLFCAAFFVAIPLLAMRETGMSFFRIVKNSNVSN